MWSLRNLEEMDRIPMEDKVQCLQEALECEDYHHFNTQNVDILLESAIGIHGDSLKPLATMVLRKFIQWIKTSKQELLYLPKTDIFRMYHPQLLSNVLDILNDLSFDESTRKEQLVFLFQILVAEDSKMQQVDWFYKHFKTRNYTFSIDTNENVERKEWIILIAFLFLSFLFTTILRQQADACL